MAKRKIRDNLTGKIIEIDESEARKYGLSTKKTSKKTSKKDDDEGVLESLAGPFKRSGKNILGALFELGRERLAQRGNVEQTRLADNPWMDEKNLDTGSRGLGALAALLNTQDQRGDSARGQVGRQALDSAAIASYATPFGRGKNVFTRSVLPGMVQGGGVSLGEKNPTLGKTATGIATGGVLAGGLDVGGQALRKVLGVPSKITSNVADDAAKNVLKSTPSKYDKALQSQGIDINKAFKKYFPEFNSIDDILGPVEARGKGGMLDDKLVNAEGRIFRTLQKSGDEVVATADDLVKPLQKRLTQLQRIEGNESKVKALKAFIETVKKNRKGGLTASELLNLKRAADSEFGKAVVEETTGAVNSQAQKILGNKARQILKDNFKSIAQALDDESTLLTLRPILNSSRAIENTGGSTIRRGSLAAVDLTRPMSMIDVITRNPSVARKIGQGATALEGKVPAGANIGSPAGLNKLAAILGPSVLNQGGNQLSSQPQQESQEGAEENVLNEQIQQGGQEQLVTDQAGNKFYQLPDGTILSEDKQWQFDQQSGEWTPAQQQAPTQEQTGGDLASNEQLQMMALNALLSGDTRTLNRLQDYIDITSDLMPTEGKPLGSAQAKSVELASSGLKSLETVRSELEEDPSLLTKQLVPGKWISRKFDSALFNTVESILRARSGAAVPETEVRRYMTRLAPTFGDSKEVVDFKLDQLQSMLQTTIDLNQNSGGGQDALMDMLQMEQY